MKAKEDGIIKRPIGGDNHQTMTNGVDKGNSKVEPIATTGVMQTDDNEDCRRVVGIGEEDPETVERETSMAKESWLAR